MCSLCLYEIVGSLMCNSVENPPLIDVGSCVVFDTGELGSEMSTKGMASVNGESHEISAGTCWVLTSISSVLLVVFTDDVGA